jgi:F-type H+-transporting ATPase subunit beta
MPENVGKVIQIAGPAVDVQFTDAHLPPIYQALRVTSEGFNVPEPISVVLEVQQHLGEGRVRCVAMEATDGMVRGMKAIDLGGPISVPVGKGTRDECDWRAGGPAWPDRWREENAHPSPGTRV